MDENDSVEIADEEERPLKRMMPWIAGGLAIVLRYFISFGPVVYVSIKFRRDLPNSIGNVLEVACFPHALLMYQSESYDNYFQWWQGMANPSIVGPDHAAFCEYFERQ